MEWEEYLHLITKDSVTVYYCLERERYHAYSYLFTSPLFRNGLMTVFGSLHPQKDKKMLVSRCPNTIPAKEKGKKKKVVRVDGDDVWEKRAWKILPYFSTAGIVQDVVVDITHPYDWRHSLEKEVREVLTHTMPFYFVDYMRACARLGGYEEQQKIAELFPKEVGLWYSAKWNTFLPEKMESATTKMRLESAARWTRTGLNIATVFRFSKVGDATFEEGILTATHRIIVCPHISSTRTRHQNLIAPPEDFSHTINEACAFLSFRLSPETAKIGEKAHLQHYPTTHGCHYCPTEYQISTSLAEKEVIITIWRDFGFTTENALTSHLPPLARPPGSRINLGRFHSLWKMGRIKISYAHDCENWGFGMEKGVGDYEIVDWTGAYEESCRSDNNGGEKNDDDDGTPVSGLGSYQTFEEGCINRAIRNSDPEKWDWCEDYSGFYYGGHGREYGPDSADALALDGLTEDECCDIINPPDELEYLREWRAAFEKNDSMEDWYRNPDYTCEEFDAEEDCYLNSYDPDEELEELSDAASDDGEYEDGSEDDGRRDDGYSPSLSRDGEGEAGETSGNCQVQCHGSSRMEAQEASAIEFNGSEQRLSIWMKVRPEKWFQLGQVKSCGGMGLERYKRIHLWDF